jgi:alkylated DNA repair protein (DNA oxidative demethylase)
VAAPEGLVYRPDFVTGDEERELLVRLEALPYAEVRMRGVVARRTVVHYGYHYGYDSWQLTPTAPLPAFLEPLRARAGELAGVPAEALAEVLVSRYPPGAGIGWHRDAPMFGTVVGISLGAPSGLRFKRPAGADSERFKLILPPRSAYLLQSAARSNWQHSLPPVAALRHSITFRTVR